MFVVDASVLAPALADRGSDGRRIRQRLRGEQLAGPDLVVIEVASVLRRQANAGMLTTEQLNNAITDLRDLPITLFPALPTLRRIVDLRANLTAYDASYVALAELLGVTLLTADRRLAHAPGAKCTFQIL